MIPGLPPQSRALVTTILLVGSCLLDPCACRRPAGSRAADGLGDGEPTSIAPQASIHWQGEMVGEVTTESAILRARLAERETAVFGDIKGRPGVAVFELSTDEAFEEPFQTKWMEASPENDYVVRANVDSLKAGTHYYYRMLSGPSRSTVGIGPVGSFRTLEERGSSRETKLVLVTSMHRYSFRATALRDLAFRQRALGFPALESIASLGPDYFVSTGDSVYYDCPTLGRAQSRRTMRAKWHKQFATPRFKALFRTTPTYWMKDDHDYRYDDADPYGEIEPLAELGAAVFLEQVPVAGPDVSNPVTYRTHRLNDLLQIWLLEGRDHRDPNVAPPGPDKTMWGTEQKAWLERTLLASDATFKIVVSPTPLIGPDDAWTGTQGGLLAPLFGGNPVGQGGDKRKRDNHTNPYGFRDEGQAFFDWLVEHGLNDGKVYFVCGDRHWQYHSVNPQGFEEFSVGALVDGSSRLGPKPGDPDSTDPDGTVAQLYQQPRAGGGFFAVTVRPPGDGHAATATFAFYDKHGTRLYEVDRAAQGDAQPGF